MKAGRGDLNAEARRTRRKRGGKAGQALVEFAVMYAAVILPLTFMTFFVAEAVWIWHGMVEFTREGARYAATHYCGQADGGNVLTYMQTHVPPVMDQAQFQTGGQATIQVLYTYNNPDFDATACGSCTPDNVSVSVTNYTFGRLAGYLRLPGIPMPSFTTNLPIESGGLDAAGNSVCQ